MKVPQSLKPSVHKVKITKEILGVLAVVLVIFAVVSLIQENQRSNQAVASHTQTLAEIQKAVYELKANNAADHQQTVKYINCVLVGLTNASNQTEALAVYRECLATAGLPETP